MCGCLVVDLTPALTRCTLAIMIAELSSSMRPCERSVKVLGGQAK
jgi:hypothetical protein